MRTAPALAQPLLQLRVGGHRDRELRRAPPVGGAARVEAKLDKLARRASARRHARQPSVRAAAAAAAAAGTQEVSKRHRHTRGLVRGLLLAGEQLEAHLREHAAHVHVSLSPLHTCAHMDARMDGSAGSNECEPRSRTRGPSCAVRTSTRGRKARRSKGVGRAAPPGSVASHPRQPPVPPRKMAERPSSPSSESASPSSRAKACKPAGWWPSAPRTSLCTAIPHDRCPVMSRPKTFSVSCIRLPAHRRPPAGEPVKR